MFANVNWLAIVVAAAASMGLGMWWYSPKAFGKAWIKASGLKKKDLKKLQKKNMGPTFFWATVAALVTAFVLEKFAMMLNATTIGTGAYIGFWAWLGFVATTQLSGVLWAGQKLKLYKINALHYLVVYVIMGAIVAAL